MFTLSVSTKLMQRQQAQSFWRRGRGHWHRFVADQPPETSVMHRMLEMMEMITRALPGGVASNQDAANVARSHHESKH